MKTNMKTKLWTALALLLGANVLMGEGCPHGKISFKMPLEGVYASGEDHSVEATLLCDDKPISGRTVIASTNANDVALGLITKSATTDTDGKFKIKFHPTKSNAWFQLFVNGDGPGDCGSATAGYDVFVDDRGQPGFETSLEAEGDCHYLKGKLTWSVGSKPAAGQKCTVVAVGSEHKDSGTATTSSTGEVTSPKVCGSTYKGQSLYLKATVNWGGRQQTVESDHHPIP